MRCLTGYITVDPQTFAAKVLHKFPGIVKRKANVSLFHSVQNHVDTRVNMYYMWGAEKTAFFCAGTMKKRGK